MTFINALASECLGRTYLLQKPDLVEVLVRILHSEHADTSLRQNALGTLQKFSLRKKPQTIMIQLDMIKWIGNVLRNEGDSLSDYSIEYATALLMNLSLRAAGKDKCEDPQIELLKVLNDLVEHDNLQVRTYVNGTLYSIFTRKKLREGAKQDEDFDDEEDDDDDEEDDEEEDIVEEEEGEFNDIIDEQGILVGEDLLVNDYLATSEEGNQQLRAVQMRMDHDRQRRYQSQT